MPTLAIIKKIQAEMEQNQKLWNKTASNIDYGLKFNRFVISELPNSLKELVDPSPCNIHILSGEHIRKLAGNQIIDTLNGMKGEYNDSYVIVGSKVFYVDKKGIALELNNTSINENQLSVLINTFNDIAKEEKELKGPMYDEDTDQDIIQPYQQTTYKNVPSKIQQEHLNPLIKHVRFTNFSSLGALNMYDSPAYTITETIDNVENKLILRAIQAKEIPGKSTHDPFLAINKIKKHPLFKKLFTELYYISPVIPGCDPDLDLDKKIVLMEFCKGGNVFSKAENMQLEEHEKTGNEDEDKKNITRKRLKLAYETLQFTLEFVGFLQKYGVIFPDLKGTNLLLDDKGKIKVGDLKSMIDVFQLMNKKDKQHGNLEVVDSEKLGNLTQLYLPYFLNRRSQKPVNIFEIYANQIGCMLYEIAVGENIQGEKNDSAQNKFPKLDEIKAVDPEFADLIENLIPRPKPVEQADEEVGQQAQANQTSLLNSENKPEHAANYLKQLIDSQKVVNNLIVRHEHHIKTLEEKIHVNSEESVADKHVKAARQVEEKLKHHKSPIEALSAYKLHKLQNKLETYTKDLTRKMNKETDRKKVSKITSDLNLVKDLNKLVKSDENANEKLTPHEQISAYKVHYLRVKTENYINELKTKHSKERDRAQIIKIKDKLKLAEKLESILIDTNTPASKRLNNYVEEFHLSKEKLSKSREIILGYARSLFFSSKSRGEDYCNDAEKMLDPTHRHKQPLSMKLRAYFFDLALLFPLLSDMLL